MSATFTPVPKGSQGRRLPRTGKHLDRQNNGHLAWLRCQPCCVPGCRRGSVEAHHVRTAANSGTAIKPPDEAAVPLCPEHHTRRADSIHRLGQRSFAERFGLDLAVIVGAMVERSPFVRS